MTQRKKAWYIIGGSIAFLIAVLVLNKGAGPKPICDPNVKTKTVIVIDHSETVASQTLEAIVERAWKHIDEKAGIQARKHFRTMQENGNPRGYGRRFIAAKF